jgi:hypothetical protein
LYDMASGSSTRRAKDEYPAQQRNGGSGPEEARSGVATKREMAIMRILCHCQLAIHCSHSQ